MIVKLKSNPNRDISILDNKGIMITEISNLFNNNFVSMGPKIDTKITIIPNISTM